MDNFNDLLDAVYEYSQTKKEEKISAIIGALGYAYNTPDNSVIESYEQIKEIIDSDGD